MMVNDTCLQMMSKELVFLIMEIQHKCSVSLQLKPMTGEVKFPGRFYIS